MSSGSFNSPEKPNSGTLLQRIEANFDAMRKALGVEDGLKNIDGITTLMLVAFGEHGIRSVEDLANCATDDLVGWEESKDGKVVRFAGILEGFCISREESDALIMRARMKAGLVPAI